MIRGWKRRAAAAAERSRAALAWAVAPWAALCGAAALAWLRWDTLLPLTAAVAVSADRLAVRAWEAWGWHRQGGRAELRRRRRHGGPAPMGELHRWLGLRAARRDARALCPHLAGLALRDIPPHHAGVPLGTAKRSAR